MSIHHANIVPEPINATISPERIDDEIFMLCVHYASKQMRDSPSSSCRRPDPMRIVKSDAVVPPPPVRYVRRSQRPEA